MRLHRLQITGFGPFAGTEDVDLESLGRSGIFLIHGPTGAGKTSILDAVCFALYAAVPGARQGSKGALRSDHAAEGVVPEVTLELTAGGRRLRVCRSPEFHRPKKRGTGTTKVQARVLLEELVDGAWTDRGTRHDEVGLLLRDVLGMGLEQFIKVVLLPQGDFAAFLRATPEDRRTVLEKLFDTHRFTDVEDWLAERRRAGAEQLRAAREELSTGLLRVNDVIARLDGGDDLLVPDWPEVATEQVEPVLAGLVETVEARAGAAMAAVEVARTRLAEADSALHEGRRVAAAQATAADARSRLAALDEQRHLYDEAVTRVRLAERAAAVSGHLMAADDSLRGLQEASRRAGELAVPVRSVTGGQADLTTVQALVAAMDARTEPLCQAVDRAARAASLTDEAAAHAETVKTHDDAMAALAAEQAACRSGLTAALTGREAQRALAAELPAREARHESLARVQRLLAEQRQGRERLVGLERAADGAATAHLDARETVLDLRERRLAGMAGELAGGLTDQSPCPVCGSCSHPAPADSTQPVRAEDLLEAEAAQAAAAEALSQARSRVAAEQARQEARAQQLEQLPDLAPDDVPAAVTDAAEQIRLSREAAAAIAGAEREVEQLTAQAERLRLAFEQTAAARASELALTASTREQSAAAHEQAQALLAEHAGSCPCSPRHAGPTTGSGESPAVLAHHRRTLTTLQSLAGALLDESTHRSAAAEAETRLANALRDNGFDGAEAARDAALTAEVVSELTSLLRATESQRAQATALLAQPDVVAAVTLPAPDLDALAGAQAERSAGLTEVGRRHALCEQAEHDLRSLSGVVRATLGRLGPAQEEARVMQALADCVAGTGPDNELRMRLSSYVLAARLAEIATLANERLATMSAGRYCLEYSDALAARGARSGLGLRVRDAWTGQPRETSSLSGGEAFMASLALALGLGDAVRAESGGFELQTLFVDEGFGTLDEDSLEQVMAVLDTLREGGRAVGIVSHVAELRHRIPTQLLVRKEQRGSTIALPEPGRVA